MAEFDQSQHAGREEAISLLWMDHSSLGRTRYERLGITVNKNQFSFLKKGGRADGEKGIRALVGLDQGVRHSESPDPKNGKRLLNAARKPTAKVPIALPKTQPRQALLLVGVTTERSLQG